jgi:hypothetical protein
MPGAELNDPARLEEPEEGVAIVIGNQAWTTDAPRCGWTPRQFTTIQFRVSNRLTLFSR